MKNITTASLVIAADQVDYYYWQLMIAACLFLGCYCCEQFQVAIYNGVVREKPVSEEQARDFLRSYSLSSVSVCNGIVVVNTATGQQAEGTDTSTVEWGEISDDGMRSFFISALLFCSRALARIIPFLHLFECSDR